MARFSLNALKDFLEGLRVEDGRNFLERPCFHYLFRVNEIAFIERCHTIEKKYICFASVSVFDDYQDSFCTKKQLLISLW